MMVRKLKEALAGLGHCRLCAEHSPKAICHECQTWFEQPTTICATCANRLGAAASRCGDCLPISSPLAQIIAPFDYGFPLDRVLHRLKYRSDVSMLPIIADILSGWHGVLDPLPDVLIPVPLHHWRLRRRGFNQAERIAAMLSKRVGVPTVADLVARGKATKPQPGLRPAERVINLADAFVLRRPVLGLSICLVDDIVTTRATLNSLAGVLAAGGAQRITAFALASARR